MVASKQLSLAVETEEERRVRLENDAATKRLRFAMDMDEERKARPWKQRNKSKTRIGFDLDLIWIEIGVFIFQGMSSLAL